MISNILYKLSAFSDFSSISYNKDDVVKILSDLNIFALTPSVVQEILPNGLVSQRMQFLGNNGSIIISILTQRIDIQITSNRKDGFQTEEIDKVKEDLFLYLKFLLSVFNDRVSLPYRLAWFTTYFYFEQSSEEKQVFCDRFLKDLDYFKTDRLPDMVARYGTQRTVDICDKKERLNVLLTINRQALSQGSDSVFDGYKIDYDINTWHGNRLNRFDLSSINEFIQQAYIQQEELNKEVLP